MGGSWTGNALRYHHPDGNRSGNCRCRCHRRVEKSRLHVEDGPQRHEQAVSEGRRAREPGRGWSFLGGIRDRPALLRLSTQCSRGPQVGVLMLELATRRTVPRRSAPLAIPPLAYRVLLCTTVLLP